MIVKQRTEFGRVLLWHSFERRSAFCVLRLLGVAGVDSWVSGMTDGGF